MNEPIIKINNLTLFNVFKEFNISFIKDQFITISGPNNCGKTTLIRAIDRQINTSNCIFLNSTEINEIQTDTYYKKVKTLIPLEYNFSQKTLEDEIDIYTTNKNQEIVKDLLKRLKLNKFKEELIIDLSEQEKLKLQLLICLMEIPEVLLIDNISNYFDKKTNENILSIIKEFQKENHITIIMTTSNLNDTIKSDYLYIINDSKIILEGQPLEVLQKDNVLNKIGLNLPFMIDLSVKLRDYDLIENIEVDMNRMVNTLWK